MRVMVTGANGFIGRVLVNRLLANGTLRGRPIEALLLLDPRLEGFGGDKRLRSHIASTTEPAVLRRALADGVDVVFHLAGIPGTTSETEYERGYQTNLLGSLELLQQLRDQPRPPIMIYPGSAHGQRSEHLEQPKCSFAAHAHMVEIAVGDLSRRGEIDGRVLRLPTIVGRPATGYGNHCAFMSELLHACAAGQAYCCPVAADAPLAWMSAPCCVDNLLRAAEIDDFGSRRVCQLAGLVLSPAQLLRALRARFGSATGALISFASDPKLEAALGRVGKAKRVATQAFGFEHDGSAAALLRNVFDAVPSLLPKEH